MRPSNKLAIILAVAMAVPPVDGRTRKGEKLMREARDAEVRKDYDKALSLYEQALSSDPADPAYQLATSRVRFQAGQKHVDAGQKLRLDGKLDEALAEFEKAYALDPGSSIAEMEVRRTRGMIEREKKKDAAGESKPEERGLTPSEAAKKQTEERVERIQSVPELRPLSQAPFNLKMNNQPPKVLFETVGKIAGINVLFDPEFTQAGSRNQSIEFTNSTLEEALDHLAVLTKAFWKPLSANSIFVTQDNTTKRRDYEEQVMKVFYLTNVNTPQELQEIATTVRGICDIRRLFTYNAQMAIIVRGEADRVALAEKVITDLDKPKSEVLIDVLVMEYVRGPRSLEFVTSAFPEGINTPITYNKGVQSTPTTSGSSSNGSSSTPAATDTTAAASIVGRKVSINGYSVVLPNGQLKLLMTDNSTRVLQSPQVRVADSAKASLKIGDRIPIASGSFQPGIGGVGINPLVNTQFQFIDVGVNVDITPKIHGTEEVSMKVDVDISAQRGTVSLGGIDQPIIGQRKVSFELRTKEGEANVLGGLVTAQETKTKTGVPYISMVPLLGRLFSSEKLEKNESELLFVLVPHIVRSPEIKDFDVKGVSVGNDQVVKLNYTPRRGGTPAAQPGQAAPPVTAPPVTAPVVVEPPKAEAPKPEPAKPVGPKLSFNPPKVDAQQGSAVTVTLMIDNGRDIFQTPMRFKFDPKVVHLNDVAAGGFLSSDGLKIGPVVKNIQNDTGEATVTLSRLPGGGGIGGSGALATLTFQAVGKGTSTVTFSELTLRNGRLQEVPFSPKPELAIEVK